MTRRPVGGLERRLAHGQVRAQLRRGLGWTVTGEWSGHLLGVLTTAVLARLLTPEAFGLVAMALTVNMLVNQLRAMGLSQAVVQRKDLSYDQVDALFWVNAAVGLVLTVLVAASAPAVASFYGQEELTGITAALSLSFVIAGLGVQPAALLLRQMHYRQVAIRNAASRLGGALAGVVAALLGAEYWSLVVLQLVQVTLTTLLAWTAVDWRPGPPGHFRQTVPLLRFGAGVSIAGLLNSVSRTADNVLVGRVLGADALGVYSRAYALLMLPLSQLKNPLGTVVQPVLGALSGDPVRYRRVYISAVRGLAHVALPGVLLLAVCAHEVVDVLLGPGWAEAVPVFQLLAVAGLSQVVTTTSGWLYVTTGRARAYATAAAVTSTATVAFFVMGLPFGVEGVAASYAVGQTLMAVPALAFACRHTPVRLRDIGRAVGRPAALAALVGGTGALVRLLVERLPSPLALLVVGLAAGGAWASCLLVWARARGEVLELVSLARGRVSEAPPAGQALDRQAAHAPA